MSLLAFLLFFLPVLFLVIYVLTSSKRKKNQNQKKGKVAVNNSEIMVPLLEKIKLTHDTYDFIFKLPEDDMVLGIGVGQCIVLSAVIKTTEHPEGEEISRKYTPTSKVDVKGTFTLVVKIYRKDVHPKFPDGGKMTQYLESLQIGDKIKISGPKGKLEYRGLGKTSIKGDEGVRIKKFTSIGMICGGTGIAPMYQLIRAIGDNAEDKTKMNVLFANKTEDDILLRNDLETVEKNGKIKLHYTLDNPPQNWKHFQGFITRDMLEKSMPAPESDVLICTCGPPMMNKLVMGLLEEIGHKKENIFKF